MQFEKLQISISINNVVHTFYYSCNQSATFSDLLEYFSYLCPNLNICTCYKFFGGIDNNNIEKQCICISHQTKILNLKNVLNNIVLKKNSNNCQHNKLNFLLYSKKVLVPHFQNIISQKDKEIEQYKIFINTLGKEIEKYKIKISTFEKEIEQYKIIKNTFEKEIQQKTEKISELEQKISQYVLLKKPSNQEQIDFYDIIVHIDSVKDINRGWKIEMNENGKKNYEKYRNENILKLGVIGNANKGKSYLLSKISKMTLPSGMSIKTEGLSIKYPDLKIYQNRKIAFLDSAGLETPVLTSDVKSMEIKDKEKNGKKDKNEETEKNENNELFKEKSREKLITELFLQNYIVNNSDILLVVVDCLSYSEQKLLMKIKKEIERSNKKPRLYIIHNLKAYTSISQVKDYINKTLLKSATFSLVEGNNIGTKTEIKKGIFFCEITKDKKNKNESNIYHLIYANEDSEAGEYYNQFTLDFIEQSYRYINNFGNYDIIQTIKERFIEKYDEIVEKGEKINMNSFENSNPNLIKLKNEKEITLKQCFIDELGFSNLKPNGFEPKYNIFNEDNKIKVRVEVPGNCTIQSEIEDGESFNIIKLTGKKFKDSKPEKIEDNIHNFREFGDFLLEIPVPKIYHFSREDPDYKNEDGLYMFEYKLDKKKAPFRPKKEKVGNY